MQDNQFHNFIFFILARIGQNQNIDGNYKLSFVSFFSLYNLVFSSSLVWIYLSHLHCSLFHFLQCKQSFYRQSKICQLGGIFRLFRITWKYAPWGIIFFLPLCRAYIQEHFDTKFDLGNCMQSKFLIGNAIFFLGIWSRNTFKLMVTSIFLIFQLYFCNMFSITMQPCIPWYFQYKFIFTFICWLGFLSSFMPWRMVF